MILLKLRIWFYYFRRDIRRFYLLKKILRFGSNVNGIERFKKEIEYLKENGLVIFPYSFEKKYRTKEVKVEYLDGFPYVDYFGKDMFFQKIHSTNHVQHYFNSILLEQDLDSPHRYCSDIFTVKENDTILDLGVAEGNFSLYYVEKAKKIYLFESSKRWIEALEKSFNPFLSKVEIINKEVADSSAESKIALDDLQELQNQSLFVKIDVDGAERSVLSGMRNLLENATNIKVAICTYHRQEDATEFEIFFKNLGYETEFTPGFMLFFHDKKLKPPYFRKGVLRAWKAN